MRIFAQQLDRLKRCDAADSRVHVAATGANRLADSLARLVQQAGDLLQAGSRGTDQADAPTAHEVREPQPDAVQDCGAAIGSHDQQVVRAGKAFQVDFILDRDVVREQEHVQAIDQRLASFPGCVRAGYRDQRQVCVRIGAMGAAQRSWRAARGLARRAWTTPSGEQRFGVLKRSGGSRVVGGAHGDDQVVCASRRRIAYEQPGIAQELAVQLAGHHHGGIQHANQADYLRADLQERDRVDVRVAADGGEREARHRS